MDDEVKYVRRSQYRLRVMRSLEGEVKMPSEIAADAEIFQNHISTTLGQLRNHGLVECINPEVKRGRLYRLTPEGEKVIESL